MPGWQRSNGARRSSTLAPSHRFPGRRSNVGRGKEAARMANVSFLPAAEADYQAALAWYQARSERAASGFEAAVDEAVQSLAANPEMWPLCDDRHRFYLLRRFPYRIVYRLIGDDILV